MFGGSPGAFLGGSQGLGFGGGYASGPSAGSPGGAPRKEDQQTCLPATVRLVEESLEACSAGGELRFHGQEAGQLLLLGVVEGLVRNANSVEFTLNDASGRLQVRHYFTGVAADALARLEEGRYAGVAGSVRTSPVPHFGASWLWPVESANEVAYHMIEVAHAALKLRRGEQPIAMTPEPNRTSSAVEAPSSLDAATLQWTPMKVEPPEAGGAAASTGEALKGAVRGFLQRAGAGREEGVAIAEIAGGVNGATLESVRKAAEELVADGELFNTVDEEHFQVL